MTLGKRIAQARRELGVRRHRDILQSDVAVAVGVGAATVSRWEADQAIPRDAVLEQLAHYLGTTPAFLRYGITDAKKPATDQGGLEDMEVGAVMLTPAQLARAEEAVAAREAAERQASQRARGARQPGKKAR